MAENTPSRHQFQSTILMEGSYDPSTQELEISFRNGSSYTLTGVPPDEWEALKNAGSPGSYFNSRLRGRY